MSKKMTMAITSSRTITIRSSHSHDARTLNHEDAPPEPDRCSTTVTGDGEGELGVLIGGTVGSCTFILSGPPPVAFTLGLGVT